MMPKLKIGDRVHFMDYDVRRVGVVMGVGTGDNEGSFRISYIDRHGHYRLEWLHENELTKHRGFW